MKREYVIGEDLDFETIIVTLIGKSERILTEEEYEVNFSAYNKNVSGEYTITIYYKEDREIKTEYIVMVKEQGTVRDEENESVWGKDLWL